MAGCAVRAGTGRVARAGGTTGPLAASRAGAGSRRKASASATTMKTPSAAVLVRFQAVARENCALFRSRQIATTEVRARNTNRYTCGRMNVNGDDRRALAPVTCQDCSLPLNAFSSAWW